MIFQTRRSTVYKGLHRVMVWRALICPSDFPCNVQVVACGGNGGNHQIHHPPLVVKEYIFPSAEAAGNLADLFRLMASTINSAIFARSCPSSFRTPRGLIFVLVGYLKGSRTGADGGKPFAGPCQCGGCGCSHEYRMSGIYHGKRYLYCAGK